MSEESPYGRLIVLTGAGASAALGLHTMASFPQVLRSAGGSLADMGAKMRWEQAGADVEWIYDRLELYVDAGNAAAQGDLNLQHALRGAAPAQQFRDQAAEALSQLQGLILQNWGRLDSADEADFRLYDVTLTELRNLNTGPLSVFTTNYDLTFEFLPQTPLSAVVNGLRQERVDPVWDPRAYREVEAQHKFVVYRLHGCSHWFLDEARGVVTYQPNPELVRRGLQPMVVFPAGRKTDTRGLEVFAFSYGAFREAVSRARVCLIIGYSFRDQGIQDCVARASADMQFIVLDSEPNSERIRSVLRGHRVLELRGRFGIEDVNEAVVSSCESALEHGLTSTEFDSPDVDALFHAAA